ncbi:acetate--CoA ligase family protein, partial [Bacteroidota bacterium]
SRTANIKNPVDVIGDAKADRYRIALEGAFKDDAVDGVFVILTPQSMTNIEDIAQEITDVASEYEKPVYTSFMGEYDVAPGVDILQRNKIPHYILPESMCSALSVVNRFYNSNKGSQTAQQHDLNGIDKDAAADLINQSIKDGNLFLTEDKALKVLEAYGITSPGHVLTTSPEEAQAAFKKLKSDVVMKIVSPDVIHKSDAGGVLVGLKSEEEVKEGYNLIINNVKAKNPDARIEGILVTQMITDSLETVIGLKRDNAFGPVIMFGLGGIFVEILKDVSFRVCPVDAEEANDLIYSIKASKMLDGVRGQAARDVKSLQNTIIRLSSLAMDHPQITELDINPLMLLEGGKGCIAADARILLKSE